VLVVKLEEPYTPFLTATGNVSGQDCSQEEVELDGSAFARSPSARGHSKWFHGNQARGYRLQKFAGNFWWRAVLDQIHFSIYPGGNIEEVLSDFQNGKLEEMPVYGQIRQS